MKKKSFEIPVWLSFPITVKGVKALTREDARKLAIEAVDKFFRSDDAVYFDKGDGAYEPVDMNKEGLYNISISVDSNYKVE